MSSHKEHYFNMENKMKCFDCVIGVDPGANGGIAEWRPGYKLRTIKMPKDLSELRGYLQYIKEITKSPIVFLEKVQLRADDVKDNPGKAFRIQQLLMQFQRLKDFIEIEGIPYVLFHPMSWQTTLKLRKQGESKAERKSRYKEVAEHYYPGLKATLWNADAVLILHAGRIKLKYEPNWVLSNLPTYIKSDLFNNEPK